MSIRRGDGPLTTDDGWWQKADGSWHPPETHPLRETAGFLEELPDPPAPELLESQEPAQLAAVEAATVVDEAPEVREVPEVEAPAPAPVAASAPPEVVVDDAPVESQAIKHGPSPAERLNEALDDSEKITLPEARPARERPTSEIVFRSEVVEAQPDRGRRGRKLPAAQETRPTPTPAAPSKESEPSEGIVVRSQVVEASPESGRRRRRRR